MLRLRSMRARSLRVLVPVAALLPCVALAESLEEVRACLAANVPQKSSMLAIRLESQGKAGWTTSHEGRLYWKPSAEGLSRMLICLESPADVRGLAYLIHEHDSGQSVWLYLPEEERVVRFSAREAARRGRIGRTAVSYEDLRYLPVNLAQANTERVSEGEIGARKVSVVGLALPPGGDSLYERIRASVDQQSCVPLAIDLHEPGGALRKTVRADPDTIRGHNVRLAHSLRIVDLKREVETELTVDEVEIDSVLPERLFNPRSLGRRRCPR